jgi:hypothetical protein
MEMDSSGIKRKTIFENEFEKKRLRIKLIKMIPPKRSKSHAELSK